VQMAGDASLAAAVEADDRTLVWKFEVDWGRTGLYNHALSDLTSLVKSVTISRDVNSSLPQEATFVEGFLAAQLQVVIGGTRAGDSEPIARLLSPWNAVGPLFGDGRVAIAVRAYIGHRVASGVETQVQQFTGVVTTCRVDSRTGDVAFGCLDPSSNVRAAIDLPLWALEKGSVRQPADDYRINSQWLIDYILRRNGLYMTPPPQQGCIFSATGHGSLIPEIGHNGFQDGWGSLGFCTEQDQVYFPGRSGWGLAYGGGPTFVPGNFARGLGGFKPLPGYAITFQAQIDFSHVADRWPGGLGQWCIYSSDSFVLGANGAGINIRNLITTGGQQRCLIYSGITLVADLGGPTYALSGWQNVWVRIDFGTPLSASTITFPGASPVVINLSAIDITKEIWDSPCITWAPPFPMSDLQVCNATGLAAGATLYDPTTWVPQVELDTGLNDLTGLPIRRGVDSWTLLKEIVGAEFGILGFDETGKCVFKNRDTVRRQNLTVEKTLTQEKLITDLALTEQTEAVRNNVTATVVSRRITAWSGQQEQIVFRLADANSVVCPPGISRHSITLDMPAWVEDTKIVFQELSSNWPPNENQMNGASRFAAVRLNDNAVEQSGVDVNTYTTPQLDVIEIEVNNPGTFDIVFATTTGEAALWIIGRAYSDLNVSDFSLTSPSSIERYGEKTFELPLGDWYQRMSSVTTIARSLLKDLRVPVPIVDDLKIVGDCRLQLQDTTTVQDDTVLGGPMYTTVSGITRQLIVQDQQTGAAKLTDQLVVRPFAAPGKWILGHPEWSVLGSTTRA
jgi:hypothetical protein